MSKIEIEITDDNEFNKGWLMYLLGLDRPAVQVREDGPDWSAGANGWDMGKDTVECKRVREVFTRQSDNDRPLYIIHEVALDAPGKNPGKVKIVVGEDAG